jgi:hypothetical protein
MRKAESLSQKETINFLNKCWMTHDGMWFSHCLQELGIEMTNKLNKAAIKSLSSIEIARMKKALGFNEPIENFDDFKMFFDEASHLVISDFMGGKFTYPEANKIAWSFTDGKCFANAGVSMLGAIENYECGVLYRVKCWLDELGIKHRFSPEIGKCHLHVSGSCSGEIHLFLEVGGRPPVPPLSRL